MDKRGVYIQNRTLGKHYDGEVRNTHFALGKKGGCNCNWARCSTTGGIRSSHGEETGGRTDDQKLETRGCYVHGTYWLN